MISGTVTESLDATISLTVLGAAGQPQQIEAVLDTGFSGFLTLPLATIESLQLPWMFRQRGMLADGQFHPFDVYAATILWDDRERTIEIEAAEVDPLIGMSLLSQHRLSIDVRPGGSVSVKPLD
jgi:clan AA aspartic protease